MREIIFRGKRPNDLDGGKWIEGNLSQDNYGKCVIRPKDFPNGFGYKIRPETLGQFTGLCDKNGKKIFEGDIIKFNSQIGHVVFEYGSFGIGFYNGINYKQLEKFVNDNLDNNYEGCFNDNFISLFEIYYNLSDVDDYIDEVEVIGNIYDNKELLNKGE